MKIRVSLSLIGPDFCSACFQWLRIFTQVMNLTQLESNIRDEEHCAQPDIRSSDNGLKLAESDSVTDIG
jgi:hypothetical protein